MASGQYQGTLDARGNWWGNASGPGGDGPGSGDAIQVNGNAVLYSSWLAGPAVVRQIPFNGVPASTASPIQAENFDQGGEGLAYHDSDISNNGGGYGSVGVDVQATTDIGGGYNVGWTAAGEWINYSVSVPRSGAYRIDFRVANGQADAGTFHLEIDGQNVTGPMVIASTGGWQMWQTVSSKPITVTAGPHLMRIVFDANGTGGAVCNLNWFQLTPLPMGDVNGDGTVNLADFLILTRHLGLSANATWDTGDLNGDGTVGLADLLLLIRNFSASIPQSPASAIAVAALQSPTVQPPASPRVVRRTSDARPGARSLKPAALSMSKSILKLPKPRL